MPETFCVIYQAWKILENVIILEHNRHNGRDKSGCNAGWAYLGMLAKIKLLPGQEGTLAGAGREIA